MVTAAMRLSLNYLLTMKTRTKIIIGIIVSVAVIALGMWRPVMVLGNVSQKTVPCQTSTATTSPNYMQAGTATSSLTHDLYGGGCTTDGSTPTTAPVNSVLSDLAYLRVMLTPSSTALSVLNVNFLASENGQDWYHLSSNVFNLVGATTTYSGGIIQTMQINQSASTTYDYSPVSSANSATTTRMAQIPTPARYIRAIFTVPIGAQPLAMWAEIVGQKQR